MKYTTINIQGNLISEDILRKIEEGTATGQQAKDFGLESSSQLRGEIEYAWSKIKLEWKHFSDRMQTLPPADPYGTSLARRWIGNFFSALNYDLNLRKSSLLGDNNQYYNISHTCDVLDELPVHIVGFNEPSSPNRNTLDIKVSGGTSRFSPHGTMQEYLNVTEHLYGMVANGISLRLMRDSGRLIKLVYIEFDLRRMLEEDKYSEFTVLFRLLHSTRFPKNKQEADQCVLEKCFQESIESGNRIRDGLSKAVEMSLTSLGTGLLQHEKNSDLRQKLLEKKITPKDYYRQILRLIYRLLFLMVTEERDLIYDSEDQSDDMTRKKRLYFEHYSIARLRRLCRLRYLYEAQFDDLWQGLMITLRLFEEDGGGEKLGIQPLAGELFSRTSVKDLAECLLKNHLLLQAIRNLNEFEDDKKNLVSINYRALDVEELGSVYEGLLELHPVIENLEASNPDQIRFLFHEGTDRKTTGSYYTRPDLVNELIKSALIPVIKERLAQNAGNKEAQVEALLKLKVCDPAAGSGHMILAAARTIAWELACVQSGESNPAPSVYRTCLREVIQHCVYAVDMNPDAVELCKLSLWLESHNSGKPISFLDHKIRCGNSLIGVADLSVLKKGIPNEAFDPVTGDDKDICRELKKTNGVFIKTGQLSLYDRVATEEELKDFSSGYSELERIDQDDIGAVKKVQNKFEHYRHDPGWLNEWTACNIWTSAFFYTYTSESRQAAPSTERLQIFLQKPAAGYGPMVGKANTLAIENRFFHWPLEFPDVFAEGGFDVMLGNPPWEKLQAEEEEYFKGKNDTIAIDKNAERRKENIEKLKEIDIDLYIGWNLFKNIILRISKFIIHSNRYPYSANGNLNLYKVFVELVRSHLNEKGNGGLVVQSGLFTDELSKELFEDLMRKRNIISAFDFVNTNRLFPIHGQMRFSLITFSKIQNKEKSLFKFYLKTPEEISKKGEGVRMDFNDVILINPNTFVCPQVSSQLDFDLLKKLYSEKLVIYSSVDNQSFGVGFWGEMFNMTRAQKFLHNTIDTANNTFTPLYEAKYFHHFDHRFATFEGKSIAECMKGNTYYLTDNDKAALKLPSFRYFVNRIEVDSKCNRYDLRKDWLLCVRSITSATNERTVISAIIPKYGVANSANIALVNEGLKACHLIATFNSFLTDYIAQKKVGNQNFNIYIIEQLPILHYNDLILSSNIIEKVVELIFTSWDIKSFADDVWKEANVELREVIRKQWEQNKAVTEGHNWNPPDWCEIDKEGFPLPPFKWDEARRAVLKAELDAIYAKLYGLTTDELRYILDPQDVYGPDFPGETFRVLKEKEIRNYGEYRTKKLVMEAWERLKKGN